MYKIERGKLKMIKLTRFLIKNDFEIIKGYNEIKKDMILKFKGVRYVILPEFNSNNKVVRWTIINTHVPKNSPLYRLGFGKTQKELIDIIQREIIDTVAEREAIEKIEILFKNEYDQLWFDGEIEEIEDIENDVKKIIFYDKTVRYVYIKEHEQEEKFELTTENICRALYLLNKNAKKLRDNKNKSYRLKNYELVNKYKIEESGLYFIKEKVMNKLIQENKLKLKGWHSITRENLKNGMIPAFYYTYNNFGFHILEKPKGIPMYKIKPLGIIENNIPSDINYDIDINFNEAIALLQKFLDT